MSSNADYSPQKRPIRYPRARLSPAKDELMVVTIPRAHVDGCDTAPALQQLEFLTETRELAERWEGQLTFAFAGWEGDKRETAEIAEIRSYFAALTEAWPYWLHFAEKVGDTVPHILRLLCRGHLELIRKDLIGWRFEDLDEVRNQLLRLFIAMTQLYDRLGLTDAMRERIAEEVAQLIESAFSGEQMP